MFLTQLTKSIQDRQLIVPNERLLIGVSGGTDSMALLHGLHQLAPKFGWELYVVHVNHQLRGDASEQDALYVAKYCEQANIPYQIKRVNVQAMKATTGGNKQAIARHLRYEAFLQVAKAWNIQKLVLAHHADDQVETILMRLLRGTGPSGLSGIPISREWEGLHIVRPLQNIFREEMESYLQAEKITPREDESNQSLQYTRNRLRLQLLPELQTYNPQVKHSLIHLGKIMAEEEQVWETWTKDAADLVATQVGEQEYQIDLSRFLVLPVALQRRTVKLILSCLATNHEKIAAGLEEITPAREADPISYHTIDQVLYLASHPSPSVWIFLPGGIKGVRSYNTLRLTKDYIDVTEQDWLCSLQVSGITYLPYGLIEAEISTASSSVISTNNDKVVFDADQLPLDSLTVRNRRPGDRMHPFGFSGHKRVKSMLMEAKIPVVDRGKHPLILAGGKIIWIPGVRRSAIAPVTKYTTHLLSLVWLGK